MRKPLITRRRCRGRKSCSNILDSSLISSFFSHFSWETIPQTWPPLVWVTVPALGPGVSEGNVRFQEASWTPSLAQQAANARAARHAKSGEEATTLPSSTYTKISAARNPSALNFITHGRSAL